MKRILICFMVLLLLVGSLAGCSGSNPALSPENDPQSEQYDWVKARTAFVKDFSYALDTIFTGSTTDYRTTRTAWETRVAPAVLPSMFSQTPPEGCTSAMTYVGYSAPEYNNLSGEYLMFKVTRTNSATLYRNDYNVIVKLGRGNTGYFIDGYTQEVVQ